MSRWCSLSSLTLISSSQSGIGPHAQDQTQHRTLTRRLAVPLVEISSSSSGTGANPSFVVRLYLSLYTAVLVVVVV